MPIFEDGFIFPHGICIYKYTGKYPEEKEDNRKK
jgi:hypothetical protein